MTKFSFLPLLALMFIFASCGTNKRITERAIYFKNLNDSLLKQTAVPYEPVFQKGDMLAINVSTANEASSRLLNPSTGGTMGGQESGGGGSTGGSVYLVSVDGNIILPQLGAIKAEGLTKSQLTEILTQKIRGAVVSDAIVAIRLMNYRITVLGEVTRPSSYTVPNERVTVLDAIGLSGDLTPYGRRDNIKVIRENDGKREMGTLNLNEGNIFQSPYFYLRQNDIVYVEMNNRKMANADQTNLRNLSIAVGLISALSVIISTITRFN